MYSYIRNLHLLTYLQAKLKKIREKYKDQDDEERQLRMEILAVSLTSLDGYYDVIDIDYWLDVLSISCLHIFESSCFLDIFWNTYCGFRIRVYDYRGTLGIRIAHEHHFVHSCNYSNRYTHPQSAGGPRVDTKRSKKKGNKQKLQQQAARELSGQTTQQQHKSGRPHQGKQRPPGRLTLQDITVQTPSDLLEAPGASTGW